MRVTKLDDVVSEMEEDARPELVRGAYENEPIAIDDYIAQVNKPFDPQSVELTELDATLYGLSFIKRFKDGSTVEINKGSPKAKIKASDSSGNVTAESKLMLLEQILQHVIKLETSFDRDKFYSYVKTSAEISFFDSVAFFDRRAKELAVANRINLINPIEKTYGK